MHWKLQFIVLLNPRVLSQAILFWIKSVLQEFNKKLNCLHWCLCNTQYFILQMNFVPLEVIFRVFFNSLNNVKSPLRFIFQGSPLLSSRNSHFLLNQAEFRDAQENYLNFWPNGLELSMLFGFVDYHSS